jgi:hypothetical protein
VFVVLDAQATTDTDNDHDQLQTISINNKNTLNNNDLAIYSTSVASGASIETLKPFENLAVVATSATSKSKPSSWADLFRSSTSNTTTQAQPIVSKAIQKSPSTTLTHNGKATTSTSYHPKTNYHVYNSNGEDSRSLEGTSSIDVDEQRTSND